MFLGFLGFSVERRQDTKFQLRKNMLCTILLVASFSVNYNRMHISFRIRHYVSLWIWCIFNCTIYKY